MCGFVGFVNYKQDISKSKNILITMNNAICNQDFNQEYYISNRIALAKSEKKTRSLFHFLWANL